MSVLNASVCVSLTQHRCQTYQWCPFHVRQTVERSDDVTVRRKIYCQALYKWCLVYIQSRYRPIRQTYIQCQFQRYCL